MGSTYKNLNDQPSLIKTATFATATATKTLFGRHETTSTLCDHNNTIAIATIRTIATSVTEK